jgi:MtrB/PioB family decaheme-associated outer membrane protein
MNRLTTQFKPGRRHLTVAIALAFFCCAGPVGAQVDPETEELTRIRSFIEFGVGYIDHGSYRFGRYRGMEDEGGYGVLNIDWYQRAAHDAEDPVYTRVQAENLGLDTRRVDVSHGRQGRYGLRASYAEMPMTRSDTGSTIFRGVGGNRLTLPENWVAAQNTAGMTALGSSLVPVRVGHERRRTGIGLDALISRGWTVSSDVRHERKQGIKTIGAVIGNSGGNPRAVILPEPIDYQTREGQVSLRYFDARKQVEFKYLVSLFDEENKALSWQNPYAPIGGWNAAAGYPTGFGQIALPPDNQFHQASLAGGYNWSNGIRWSGDVAVGRMTQDEAFLPYTINPVLAESIVQPLPRSSLDGRIDTTVANLRLSGRGSDRFSWGAHWRYDDRDNRTPRDEYVYIGGDSNLQNVAPNSSARRFNEPASFRDSRLRFDGSYRLAKRTRFTGALERRSTERTYSEREKADETLARFAFHHAYGGWVDASLRYEWSKRDGSTYVGNEPFLSGYSPGFTGTLAGGWENPPLMRRPHLADRERDRFGARVTFTPVESWHVAFDLQLVDDDYTDSALGVRRSSSDVFTMDVGFAPSERWSTYGFLSRETLEMEQNGASIRTATREADALDPARRWNARHRDNVLTSGAGLQLNFIERRLKLSLDFLRARSDNNIDVTVGSALNAAPLPVDYDRLQSVTLQADWRLRDDWSMRVKLWNERFHSSNFTLDDVAANQLANVILLGEGSPDYEVNVVTLSFVYRF